MKMSVSISLLLLCISCKHKPPEPSCGIPMQVSFSRDLIPLFTANCSIAGCHSGPTPQGNLNLEPANAYAQLMKPGSGYIDTVNPRFSVLHAQMNSASNPMPPSGKLDQCKLDLVLRWIEQKAPNN